MFQHYIPDTSRFLKVGDCIWLHHSEAEAALSVKRRQEAVDKKSYKSIELTKWLSITNLQVSITYADGDSSEGYSGTSDGLWQIEGSDFSQGGYVQFDKGYRLRHLSTGYYL